MIRLFLVLMLFCSNVFAAITDGKFGVNQIFDVQYYWSGNTLNASNFIAPYNKNFQTVTVTAGQYFQFFESTTNPGTYGLKLMNSDGTQHSIVHDYGDITALGSGAIFYIGSGFFGNVITTAQGYSYGASATFTNMDTSVTASDLNNYIYASSTPLASGQTASTTATPAAPTYITATNIGFETGNTNSWTVSNSSGAANWNAGSGAAVVTGLQHTPGSGKSWTVTPYGSYMLSLQPGSGSPTFDSATASLGLTSAQNTAIKNLLIQQAQASGGDPTPTNAAWTKRDLTLQAGVTYKIAWQYLSTDYAPFNDGSIITLVHKTDASKVPTLNNAIRNYALLGFTNLGTGDYSVDSYGATGWQIAIFTVPVDGDYSLGFAAFNLGDTALSPILLIDEQPGTTLLNGQTFTSISPNPGTGAPTADGGGGSSTPVYSSDITPAQQTILDAARARQASITSGNRIDLYSDGSGNSVTIEQVGSFNRIKGLGTSTNAHVAGFGTAVDIKQGSVGAPNNLVELYVQGNGNNVTLSQARNTSNGSVSSPESGGHFMSLSVTGDINSVTMRQGNDGGSSSGHFVTQTIVGNFNNSTVIQSNNNEKRAFIDISGNGNNSTVLQSGTGNHYLDLSLSGNNNNASVTQQGSGSHKATINLSNVGGPSAATLVQQGSTGQVYNITQQCATLAGCSVSVTQGQ